MKKKDTGLVKGFSPQFYCNAGYAHKKCIGFTVVPPAFCLLGLFYYPMTRNKTLDIFVNHCFITLFVEEIN